MGIANEKIDEACEPEKPPIPPLGMTFPAAQVLYAGGMHGSVNIK